MTWKQIKKAVEETGLAEDDEISLIQCENGDGDGTFHRMRLGKTLKLTENTRENVEDVFGCAI